MLFLRLLNLFKNYIYSNYSGGFVIHATHYGVLLKPVNAKKIGNKHLYTFPEQDLFTCDSTCVMTTIKDIHAYKLAAIIAVAPHEYVREGDR